MGVVKSIFGQMKDGRTASLYTLKNSSGMTAVVSDFGAVIVKLMVPGSNGTLTDVVLGFDKLEYYFDNSNFFGALVGPCANRTAGAAFSIDGRRYSLAVNDGPNNLHSDIEKGFHKQLWTAETGSDHVTFTLEAADGELGFPGNRKISVTYTITEDNALMLHYHASSDRDTIFNLTNHSYFNLAGQNSGRNIEDHIVYFNADGYTPIAKGSIPTGKIDSVKGTPFDFTVPGKVGARINDDFDQLKIAGGYDHNYVINDYDGKTLREAAWAQDPASGRRMTVSTTLPGVQFYTGNYVTKIDYGKSGAGYDKRSGMCFESQYFPDSANDPAFEKPVFGPDRDYDAVTEFRFS
jgi:aldose 1-epimerase